MGTKITMKDGVLQVPSTPIIPFIEGDGIGPDIWAAAVRVIDAAVKTAYGDDRKIEWMEVLAGQKAFDKNGPDKILTQCIMMLIIGFPILAFVQNSIGFYFSAVIIGFGIGVVFPTFQAIIINLADAKRRGAANSTLYTALDTGMGLGMIIAGLIAQYVSISFVFLISAFTCVIGLLFFKRRVLHYYERNVNL